MIKPTVGRVVWFWQHKPQTLSAQPQAAIIAAVWSDTCVNLTIFERDGVPRSHPPTSIHLRQEGEPEPESGPYCEWMPYQIGQTRAQFASGEVALKA
jgi:hypothetical protein